MSLAHIPATAQSHPLTRSTLKRQSTEFPRTMSPASPYESLLMISQDWYHLNATSRQSVLLRGPSRLSPYQRLHVPFLTMSQQHQGHRSTAPGLQGKVATGPLSPDAPWFRYRAVGKTPVPAAATTTASSCPDLYTPSQIPSQTVAEELVCLSSSGTISTILKAVYVCVPSRMGLLSIPHRLWSSHDRKTSQPPYPAWHPLGIWSFCHGLGRLQLLIQ